MASESLQITCYIELHSVTVRYTTVISTEIGDTVAACICGLTAASMLACSIPVTERDTVPWYTPTDERSRSACNGLVYVFLSASLYVSKRGAY